METIEAPVLSRTNKSCCLHEITFPEALTSKIAVADRQGRMVAGPDRKNLMTPDMLFLHWQRQVSAELKGGGGRPSARAGLFSED